MLLTACQSERWPRKFKAMFNNLTTILLFFFMLTNSLTNAQNLVPNPSFEDTISCPYQSGDIENSQDWTTSCGSPDYFNLCANPYDFGVPNNVFGYQMPSSGNAYTGFATYSNSAPNSREFPTCALNSPLTIGVKYFISFKVALSLNIVSQVNSASNKIGAMFTTGVYQCNVTNNPHVFTDTIITDSLDWTRINGSFVADSAYNYLLIGNFFDDANTDTINIFNDFTYNAYYFLDDVAVGTDSSFIYNYNYLTEVSENNLQTQFSFSPNPVSDYFTLNQSFNEPYDLIIYNALGQQLYEEKNITTCHKTINTIQFTSGILFITIKSNNQTINYKLLKL